MNDITCWCGSKKITHYRQIRKDGVPVVTARCENGHIPERTRPFYPVAQFDVWKLPPLPSQANEQMPLFDEPVIHGSGMFIKSATLFERMTGEK
jgi:hypothetical protein